MNQVETGEVEDEENEFVGDDSESVLARGYDYLLSMKIWSLTLEKAEQLLAELSAKTKELEELEGTSPSQIWLNDLDAIEAALDDRDVLFAKAQEEEANAQKKNQKRRAKVQKKKTKGKKNETEWDSEQSSDDEEMEELSDEDEEEPKPKSAGRKPMVKNAASKKGSRVIQTSKAQKPQLAAPKMAENGPQQSPSSGKEHDVPESTDLAERMQRRLHVSPPPKSVRPNAAKKRAASPVLDENENMSAAETTDVDTAANKGPQLPKKSVQNKKKAPSRKTKAGDLTESEDEFDYQSEEEISQPVASAPPARARSARSRKPISYSMNDDSSDESMN